LKKHFLSRLTIILSVALFWAHPVQATSQPIFPDDTILLSNQLLNLDDTLILYVPGSTNKTLQSAINEVPNGGVIEVTGGIYIAPSSGFSIIDQSKSFTIRSAVGENVIISGNNTNRLMDIRNSPVTLQGSITFQGITFANGFSSAVNLAGGLTISDSNVTFYDCTFQNNQKRTYRTNTSAGAMFITGGSSVYLLNSQFNNNTSEDGGAGLSTRDSKVYIHGSQFVGNRTTTNLTSAMPVGGAINIVNSQVRITNTRFDNNQAAGHGGAIYIIGQWSTMRSDIILANVTFINNQIVRNVASSYPVEGGAINIEDNSYLRIYHSRFITNSARIGGGVNIFRAKVEIYQSAFLGNRATETTSSSGFGGAINFNYYDQPTNSSLLIEDTLIQGKYGSVYTVAQFGGGIHAHGNPNAVKPPLTLRRVVLNDLDITGSSGKGALGGGIEISDVDFLMEDSYVLNCDATNAAGGFGGGMIAYARTNVNILRSVFAYNSTDSYGGAISIFGSQLNITGSLFYHNEVSPGLNESENYSYGAALFSGPDTANNIAMTGSVVDSQFVSNIGMAIYDDDRSPSPINAMTYNNNSFYETAFSGKVFRDSLLAAVSPQGLNDLVVNRSGSSTDKSPSGDNQALASAPQIARLFAIPGVILPSGATGDDANPVNSYLGYVWDGSSGVLDGSTLTNNAGALATTTVGQHTLSVNGTIISLQVPQGSTPTLNTSITAGNPDPLLSWVVASGSFLTISADQGLSLTNSTSGSVSLPSVEKIYCVYAVTEEGGVFQSVDPRLPLLSLPEKITILIGLNNPIRENIILVSNIGGQSLDWTAHTDTPELVQIIQSSGTVVSTGIIPIIAKPSVPGQYLTDIHVDAGEAGSGTVTIEIFVVNTVDVIFLPVCLN